MGTVVLHPMNEEQQKALQTILGGFKVPFEKEPVTHATEYLISSKANKHRLDKAMEEYQVGEGTEIKTDDLWK